MSKFLIQFSRHASSLTIFLLLMVFFLKVTPIYPVHAQSTGTPVTVGLSEWGHALGLAYQHNIFYHHNGTHGVYYAFYQNNTTPTVYYYYCMSFDGGATWQSHTRLGMPEHGVTAKPSDREGWCYDQTYNGTNFFYFYNPQNPAPPSVQTWQLYNISTTDSHLLPPYEEKTWSESTYRWWYPSTTFLNVTYKSFIGGVTLDGTTRWERYCINNKTDGTFPISGTEPTKGTYFTSESSSTGLAVTGMDQDYTASIKAFGGETLKCIIFDGSEFGGVESITNSLANVSWGWTQFSVNSFERDVWLAYNNGSRICVQRRTFGTGWNSTKEFVSNIQYNCSVMLSVDDINERMFLSYYNDTTMFYTYCNVNQFNWSTPAIAFTETEGDIGSPWTGYNGGQKLYDVTASEKLYDGEHLLYFYTVWNGTHWLMRAVTDFGAVAPASPPAPYSPVPLDYSIHGIGLFGIFMMTWSGWSIADKIRKKEDLLDIMEQVGIAFAVFLLGLGLFMVWVYA